MSAPLDNPPYRSEVTDKGRILSGDWTRWFQLFWARVGSAVQALVTVKKSAQSASIGTTTAYTVTLGAIYRVNYRQRVTTAATATSSLTFTAGWREGSVTQSQSGTAMTGNTTTTQQNGVFVFRADSGTVITYAWAYATTGATSMVWAGDVVVELIG